MQITFLVGNGFDVSCGLNTSYQNFYDWYSSQNASPEEHIKAFQEAINLDRENWSDFEEALGRYTSRFAKETVRDFIDCYEDARQKLIEYLEKETEKFEIDMSDDSIQEMKQSLASFYAELKPREKDIFTKMFQETRSQNSTISFISFNYTNTLDQYIYAVSQSPLYSWKVSGNEYSLFVDPEVIHVHGQLDLYPIFGVNDESQIENKELLEYRNFDRLMIKPKGVEAIGQKWHEKAKQLIDNSTIICIFGMSMGYTDTDWFYQIMEWLNTNPDRQIIIFWHTDTPSDKRSIWQMIENEDIARRKLTDHSALTDQQIEQLNNRIHVIENTKSVLTVSRIEQS